MSDNSQDSALLGVPAVVAVPQGGAPVGGAASVADQSFASAVGSVAVFGRTTRRTILELEQNEVVVRKGDRGVPSSKAYVTNRAAATKSLSNKFLGSFHLRSKNADGENVQKSQHIQEQFVSNLMVMKELRERAVQYDLRGPFQVPAVYHDIVGEDAWEGRWDTSNPNRVIVDLLTHWGSVSLDHVLKWQTDFNGYSEDEDMISSIWMQELLTSSMDVELRRQVETIEQELDVYQRGGITFLKIVMDTLFKMSTMAEDSLKQFIKDFGEKGLAKIPYENVRVISFQVNGVAERLADANLLRSESFIYYVNGYTRCSVAPFKAVFQNKATEYMYLDATGTSPFSSMSSPQVLAKIKETSRVAEALYDNLNLGKKWNLPGKEAGLHANIVSKCDNCGAPDHLANKCTKPRDDERCKAARDAREKAKEDLRGRGGGGRGGGGRGGRGGRGDGGRGNSDERAPWKESEGSNSNSNSGVKMIDGAWKMLCNKGCGWNSTHTTGFHNEQSRSALNFKLPPEHMWWRVSGKQYAAAGAAVILPSGADATQVVQDRQQMRALTGVVDQYMTGTDNAEMSSFLGDMRRALGN